MSPSRHSSQQPAQPLDADVVDPSRAKGRVARPRQFFQSARVPAPVSDGPLLTLDEVSERLQLNKKAVYRLIEVHGLPVRRIGGLKLRVDAVELDAWTKRSR